MTMHRFTPIVLALSFAILAGLSQSPFRVEAGAPQADSQDLICPTRLMLRHPERCPQTGPGAKVLELARLGLYPERPLPTIPIDASMSYFPFGYLRASNRNVPIYPTAEAARRGRNASSRISPGFVFLSYVNSRNPTESGNVYRSQQGYVRGNSVSQVTPSYHKGLAFTRTPERPFGWINSGGSCPQRTPGGTADYVDRCFMRYEVVQIYLEQVVDGETWYLIGPDEWLQAQFIAMVEPDTQRPDGVDGERWISVNLDEQTITAYEDGQLVYATVGSTGRYGVWTQPGTFQVWAKLERDNMTGGVDEGFYYLEDVPWVLYFDQARALHGTYWHNQFGKPNSRGCVNLSITDARWFFEFAQEGTWVHVWDPSGETPTDPALYGAGGA
ncbi:MAG: L,D-transpeptidase family protein [Anaerolineales bacterium]|nr:L,D-transpeptidase family protein [Anaerolineales bacterium]